MSVGRRGVGGVGASPASNGKRPSPGRPHLDAGRLGLIRVPAVTFAPRHVGTCSPTARGAVTSSRSATLGAWESGVPWGLEEAVRQAGIKHCFGPSLHQEEAALGKLTIGCGHKLELFWKREELGRRGRLGLGNSRPPHGFYIAASIFIDRS